MGFARCRRLEFVWQSVGQSSNPVKLRLADVGDEDRLFQADRQVGQFGLVSAIQLDDNANLTSATQLPAKADDQSAFDPRGEEPPDEQGDAEARNSVVKKSSSDSRAHETLHELPLKQEESYQ